MRVSDVLEFQVRGVCPSREHYGVVPSPPSSKPKDLGITLKSTPRRPQQSRPSSSSYSPHVIHNTSAVPFRASKSASPSPRYRIHPRHPPPQPMSCRTSDGSPPMAIPVPHDKARPLGDPKSPVSIDAALSWGQRIEATCVHTSSHATPIAKTAPCPLPPHPCIPRSASGCGPSPGTASASWRIWLS